MRTFVAGLIVIVIGLLCAAGWGYGAYSKELHIRRCAIDRVEIEKDVVSLEMQLRRLGASLTTLRKNRDSGMPDDRIAGLKAKRSSLERERELLKEALAKIDREIAAAKEQTGLDFLLDGG